MKRGFINDWVTEIEEVVLNEENGYTHTWKDMVEYESGKEEYPYYPIYSIEAIETIDGYETTYSVEKMKDEDVYPFDENGQLVITNTAIDKQAPNVSVSDHVGIVESCDGTTVYTVEGNSGDAVKENSYTVHSASIMGYGIVSGM